MQIKTAMIFHLMLIRMADRQAGRREKEGEKKKKKCRQRWEEKWTYYTIGEIDRWCNCYGKHYGGSSKS